MKKHQYDLLIATGIYPPDIGGPATYSKLLYEELPLRGYSVKMLSFGEVRSLPKIVRHLAYAWKVWRLGRDSEVIYVQDPVSVGLPVMMATALMARPYILKIVGDYAWEQGSQRFGVKDFLDDFSKKRIGYSWPVRLLKLIQLSVARRAAKIIVPSHYLKKIVSNWGVDPNKISVIYNAFDEPKSLADKKELRGQLGLNGRVLISIGRLVPWKGFDLLINVFAGLAKNYNDLTLYIVGEGPEKNRLQKEIADLKLESSVVLLGRLPQAELLKYLKASDLFILNTSYEGFSHQLLEVMWCGTPMITTAVGGNVELVKDGENGLLIDFNDRPALDSCARRLLDNPEFSEKLADAAKLTVSSFNKERMLESLVKEIFSK